MKFNILHAPLSLFNGKDARSGGEWPGKLPCKFKSAKIIIRPPENDIFLSVIKPEDAIIFPKKRFICSPPSKEYAFRSCSRYVPPPQEETKQSKIQIYPHDAEWTYSFRPLDSHVPLLRPHYFPYTHENKNKLLIQLKLRNAKEEFAKRLMKEFRNNPRIKQLYQDISENKYIQRIPNTHVESQKNIIHNSMKKILDHDYNENTVLYLTKVDKLQLPKIEVK